MKLRRGDYVRTFDQQLGEVKSVKRQQVPQGGPVLPGTFTRRPASKEEEAQAWSALKWYVLVEFANGHRRWDELSTLERYPPEREAVG